MLINAWDLSIPVYSLFQRNAWYTKFFDLFQSLYQHFWGEKFIFIFTFLTLQAEWWPKSMLLTWVFMQYWKFILAYGAWEHTKHIWQIVHINYSLSWEFFSFTGDLIFFSKWKDADFNVTGADVSLFCKTTILSIFTDFLLFPTKPCLFLRVGFFALRLKLIPYLIMIVLLLCLLFFFYITYRATHCL